MDLDKELETFRRELPNLLPDHEGQFALVQGERVDSLWPTENAAYEAGCDRFGLALFLVKRVEANEPRIISFHDVTPRCRP
ncbi:MAG TPA: hypothetical protein VG013_06615 [Gemmataceae bacterium]|jgi:hypothetical protein|nr:hypothetical protein [Gemmataceae bacterium]